MASPTSRKSSMPVASVQRVSTQGSTNNQGYPRRYQPDLGGDADLLSNAPRRYSTLNGNIEEQRQALRLKLQQKENGKEPLPVLTRADQSESYSRGPWARKIILCLDGGGVRGLCSLYILKMLMFLCEEIETGRRATKLPPDKKWGYLDPHSSSEDCGWHRDEPRPSYAMSAYLTAKDRSTPSENGKEISQLVKRCLQDTKISSFKPCHYFDYFAGTSTGGLSAIMLGRMEMPIQVAIQQYDIVGNVVFGHPRRLHSRLPVANFIRPKYCQERMKTALKQVIDNGIQEELKHADKKAEDALFRSDERRSRTIVLAHGDIEAVENTYIFRTYDHYPPPPLSSRKSKEKHRNPGPAHSEEIYKVALATSAAPRYFSKVVINDHEYRDGAIGANNPAEEALNEVMQMHEQPPKIIVSIGTGDKENKPKSKKPKTTGIIKDWHNVAKLLTQIATESAKTASTVEGKCDSMGILHWRWTPPASIEMGEIKLDEWLPRENGKDTKASILKLTTAYLSQPKVHKRLWECARWLVLQRRLRARTERWEVFARRFVYYCPEPLCHSRVFSTRAELRDHGTYEHSYVCACNVQGHHELKYACVLDRCRGEGVHLYRTKAELEDHLRGRLHKIKRPQLRSQRWLEGWLDEGRHTHVQAVKRQTSNEIEPTETEFEQDLEFDDYEISILGTDPSPELRGIATPLSGQDSEKTAGGDIEHIELNEEKEHVITVGTNASDLQESIIPT